MFVKSWARDCEGDYKTNPLLNALKDVQDF